MNIFSRLFRSIAIFRRFWPYLAEHAGGLLVVGLISLLAVGMELLRPWPVQWIFDYALVPSMETSLTPQTVILYSAIAALVIALSRAGLDYYSTLKQTRIGHAVTRGLRFEIFKRLTRLPPDFHARHKSGDLLVRLTGDVPMLRTMLVDSMVHLASRVVLILATVIMMFTIDPVLSVIGLVLTPVLVVVVRVLSGRLTKAIRKQRRKEGAMADYLHETIASAEMVQSLGRESYTAKKFNASNRRSARAGLKAARIAARMKVSIESLLGLTLAATFLVGSLRVLDGALRPGELLVFITYVRGLLKPIRSASKHAEKIAKGSACSERIEQILDEPVLIRETAGDLKAPARPRSLVFQEVLYRFDHERAALDGVDIKFRNGEMVAVVGHSGAGKSTLSSLALRIREPDSGRILLDDVDLKEYTLHSLRACFGLSMQESALFGDTIRENLLLGKPDADDEELWEACRASAADRFLELLPDGLDTMLGASGQSLSGGERHRLCLARTLLRRSPILILDEPFRGLDQSLVAHLRSTLTMHAQQGMVIVITHDLEHLAAFDRVVFLDQGRVVGDGTHEELLRRNEHYRRFTSNPTHLAS